MALEKNIKKYIASTRADQPQHSALVCGILAPKCIFHIRPGFLRAPARFRFQFIERLKGTILMNGS
jgi:hypothetical protein